MATLFNITKNQQLVGKLKLATSFRARAQGLIGTRSLPFDEAIWFPKTNWIHTCFMSIPIDVIYLDKSMKVQKLDQSLKPWRLPAPVFKAHSVVELAAGFIEKNNVHLGDELHVGD